ncbi:MAG: IS630 family transposase, partial [Betaproteobacteria bacterium]|nr:IS630 family transposase [Betaproteobacteria bacterium]
VRTKDKLKSATSDHMKMLETRPALIKAYFQDPQVMYAA